MTMTPWLRIVSITIIFKNAKQRNEKEFAWRSFSIPNYSQVRSSDGSVGQDTGRETKERGGYIRGIQQKSEGGEIQDQVPSFSRRIRSTDAVRGCEKDHQAVPGAGNRQLTINLGIRDLAVV